MRPACRNSRNALVFLTVVLFAFVAVACAPAAPPAATAPPATAAPAATQASSASSTSKTAPTGAAGTPKSGGTITMVVWQEPENLNVELVSQTVAFHIADLFEEGLLNVNEKGQWFPVLATEVPTTANGGVSADGKTITYHLRKGVKWQDGTDFTCEDIKFTQQVITTPNIGALDASAFANLTVTCPDPNTAVLTFKDFKADWIRLFNGNGMAYVFPKDAGKPEDMKTWAYNRKPIGTGPFKVDEFVTGDHITLSKNPNYWQPGKPYLDKIIVRVVPSSEVGMQMMKSGEADVMWNNTEADLPALAQMSNVKIFDAPQAGGERLILNLTENADPSDNKTPHPILGDVKVREAIALGIDKQTIIDKLLNGKALPGSGELNVDPYNCGIKPVPYDPAKAKQLLDAAGWVPGSDGIRVKNGTRLSLKYQTTTGNKLREDSQVLIVENMKAIGVEFRIENQPSSVLIGSWSAGSPRKHGNFDIIMYTTNASIDPGSQMYNYFDSKSIPSPTNQGGINYSRWNDPQTDQLIEKAGTIPDWNQRKDLYCQAAQRIVDGYSHIYLYQRFNLHSFNTRVQGWIPTPWLGPLWNAADIWVTK
ncbi:MAG: peptide ABC transporter substrate-binding protein [Chloroflexi bacterium]|nr:peptide ABC transporter substrate-binding protein [Chloroflexota bacterium]